MREKIIDFHVHPFVEEKENMCFYKQSLSFENNRFVTDLKNSGITSCCGSVISSTGTKVAEGFEAIQKLNRHALELKEKWGDFYIPGVHVHPAYVRESCEELELMHNKGVKLVGELVPYMQEWSDYSCKEFGEILDVIGELGMVVSYHSMDDAQMEKMIANHPKVTFVAAHPNDRDKYPLHLERLRKYPNAYLDLSGTGLFRYGMLKHGVDTVGAEKFLFGTDYPITNPHMYVQAVEFEHISEEAKDMIFYKNAQRILEL
ncbi:MAG: amidohydrolase [Agathobacter sp.]|nr:amidohydrolase [Agathobacter sp.]